MKYVYWTTFLYKDWRMYIAFTEKGICYIGSPNKPFTEVESWIARKFPKAQLIEKVESDYSQEISAYLTGEIRNFSCNIDLYGTDFQLAVWQATANIPYGELYTYSDIAAAINNKKAVRAVGAAIGANPLLMIIPCHRVIAKSGALTGFRGGLDMKEGLIALEKSVNNK